MRTLLVDHDDPWAHALFTLLTQANGEEPTVVHHLSPLLAALPPTAFDNIVLTSGQGDPRSDRDLAQIARILDGTRLPVLGVGLGHQLLARHAGALLGRAPRPRYGHAERVAHAGADLFHGLPEAFTAVRSHTWCVEDLPPELEATAWAEDGVLMGLRHRELPRWGVQFDPGSAGSEFGREILANFRDLTAAQAGPSTPTGGPARTAKRDGPAQVNPPQGPVAAPTLQVVTAELRGAIDAEAAHGELFAASADSFWLDSSSTGAGAGRFSFLGDATGPLSETITYNASSRAVVIRAANRVRVESGSIFDVLERGLAQRRVEAVGLPFDFTGGYIGWLGYEMKADCGGTARHRSTTPDAAWIFADRLIAVDHLEDRTYVLAVHQDDEEAAAVARTWVDITSAELASLPQHSFAPPAASAADASDVRQEAEEYLMRDRDRYLTDIEQCRRELKRGESYALFLTDQLRVPFDGDELSFYHRLRRANPAPHSALLRIGGDTVFCASPERFLRVRRDRVVVSTPVQGAAARSTDPALDAVLADELAADPRSRAESLMALDLVRNDLGQICETGSVSVERLSEVESCAAAHHLASTVTGRLKDGVGPVEAVRQCFPASTVTGTPRRRSVDLLDRVEGAARGIHTGCLGYFGLSGGADLATLVNVAVRHGRTLHIGAGRTITLESDPYAAFEEMLLRTVALVGAARVSQVAEAQPMTT
ncbi:chorismate-binding protein [Streptomyces sp. NPDC058548]|uniref:chorismate-binding protein n=1 Tax=unclassified Streptomyces TaxID=2593676 RepID=UPI00364BEDA2